ncbi:MAG TPA: MJ0042-type zinc finger domain-containing protein [Caulobacterales bacterium]|nr:MJ0042-type zinc finger domain-containing protein [Caulobacterales bacterium]
MILTCTSCSTRYYADDAAIGPAGRAVRCAACGHAWFAEPQLMLSDRASETGAERARSEPLTRERVERLRRAAEQPGPAPSAAAKFRAQQAERMAKERKRAAVAAWGATGVAIAASAAGMVVFRQDVAEMWPRSASAFAALGLDVNVYGLEFYDLAVERNFDGPTPVLIVSGEVRNIGRDNKTPPPVRISLRDEHSNEIYHTVQAVQTAAIAPGAAAPFHIRVENPPSDAVDLEATFASFAEAATANAHGPATHQAPLELNQPLESEPAMGEPAAYNAQQPADDGLAPRFSGDREGHG